MNERQKKWVQTELAIDQAVDHADRVSERWSDRAYELLTAFVACHDAPFVAHHVRLWAAKQGLDEPPTTRAWGGVFLRASRRKLIERAYVDSYHYPGETTHTQTNIFWKRHEGVLT